MRVRVRYSKTTRSHPPCVPLLPRRVYISRSLVVPSCFASQANPNSFGVPLQFEIQYECLVSALNDDLEWKLTYVGSAESDAYDQVLDTVLVGPVVMGSYKFVFQADPPDVSKIPAGDVLGVTVLLLTCSYNAKEFIRVGYYVNNEYADEELRETPPPVVRLDRVVRNILAEKPRVTRFPCEFDQVAIPTIAIPSTPQMDSGAVYGAGGFNAAPATPEETEMTEAGAEFYKIGQGLYPEAAVAPMQAIW